MTINLYIGDTNVELAEKAVSVDPRAFLLDHSNCKDFVINPPHHATIYTSLGDLPTDQYILSILDLADTITYWPPKKWSNKATQEHTEHLLSLFVKLKNNVNNFSIVSAHPERDYLKLQESRKSEQAQLWISGCSYSYGAGVTKDQRYGQLLAQQLNLPVSFLTWPGSSIEWACDQILRSDIRAGDIVVWGLTNEHRYPYWSKDHARVSHITVNNTEMFDKYIANKLLVDTNNCLYKAVTQIYQVINYCNKIGAKLVILGLLPSVELSFLIHNNKEYFPHPYGLVDFGSVDGHPGPLQHQLYADFCQSALKKLNYI
jgi:hypothetical protein